MRRVVSREVLEGHFGTDGRDKEGRLAIFQSNRSRARHNFFGPEHTPAVGAARWGHPTKRDSVKSNLRASRQLSHGPNEIFFELVSLNSACTTDIRSLIIRTDQGR